jgi:hypothetical protein
VSPDPAADYALAAVATQIRRDRAKSAGEPDGCTLLVVLPNIAVNPSALQPIHDFDPVTVAVTVTVVLTAHSPREHQAHDAAP